MAREPKVGGGAQGVRPAHSRPRGWAAAPLSGRAAVTVAPHPAPRTDQDLRRPHGRALDPPRHTGQTPLRPDPQSEGRAGRFGPPAVGWRGRGSKGRRRRAATPALCPLAPARATGMARRGRLGNASRDPCRRGPPARPIPGPKAPIQARRRAQRRKPPDSNGKQQPARRSCFFPKLFCGNTHTFHFCGSTQKKFFSLPVLGWRGRIA